ncbi:MAG: tryptophan--tRNA ligase [Fimbriimonadaceae bacterium]|nr:tryptophan--tRNA ligase [Fimbriimonadaceae bacterium]
MSGAKRLLSGMRATGDGRLHIGNYEGALRNWVDLQDQGHQVFAMVADWHVLTTAEPGRNLAATSREIAKDFVAAGLDPERTVVFRQSDVKEHAELTLLFGMMTGIGKLERNPTYKDMVQDIGGAERATYGLLGYPVLQAADILLYRPYGVPVGRDQAPHLELGREIARTFNSRYGEVFPEFASIIPEDESRAKVPGLDADAEGRLRKMSKSYDNCIYLAESDEETAARIKSAFTTPSKMRKTDPGIPEGCAVCQMLRIYSPDWQNQWQEDRDGIRGCMQNKKELTEALNAHLRPFRERRAELTDERIEAILQDGASRARAVASETMDEVRRAMLLV